MAGQYWLVKCEFDECSFDELKRFVYLADLKANDKLADMRVVQRGQRLSIQPVAEQEWKEVYKMGGVSPA